MTDRELLELAAKAYGLTIGHQPKTGEQWLDGITFIDGGAGSYARLGVYTVNGADRDGPILDRWNPLDDDGDALRLAVKLCFSIEQWQTTITVRIGDELIRRELSDGKMTRLELTRRAIVRAAAEIQRAKEAA